MSKPHDRYVGDDLVDINVITTEWLYATRKAPQGFRRWCFRDIPTKTKFECIDNYRPAANAARRWAKEHGYSNLMLEAPQ